MEEFLAAAGYQVDAAATTRCGAQVTGQQFAAAALVPGASGSRSSSAGASQHTAAGETMLGTTSKAASVAVSAPASAASHLEAPVSWNSSGSSEPKLQTAGTAATEQPGDRARVKAGTVRRYAYSELDQMARRTLAEIDWSWTSCHQESKDILDAFYEYQRSNDFAPKVL